MSLEHSPARKGALGSDPMLRPSEVMARTGLSRTTIWRHVRAGTFPPPTELGQNSIGWPESLIRSWLANRPRRTYGAEVEAPAPEAA